MSKPNDYDRYYLNQDLRKEPKESFKFIASTIKNFTETFKNPNIGDIGCASGELLMYLKHCYPDANYFGFDIDELLLEKASKELPYAKFALIDITDKKTLPSVKFDLVFLNGVIGYYDNISSWAVNLVEMLSKEGRAYVFSTFNPENVDVLIRLKNPTIEGSEYMTFGNTFSFYSIEKELKKLNAEVKFHEFNISIDVEKHKTDPIRSWTFKDESGNRITKNGGQIIQNYYLLEISRNNI